MSNEIKLFYSIGEVADLLQIKPYVLRYWETEFKKLNPQKSLTGQRTYRIKDIQIALTIKKLLYDDKYTIAGAIQKLDELAANNDWVPFPNESPASQTPEKSFVAPIHSPETQFNSQVDSLNKIPLDSLIYRQKVMDLKTLLAATKKLLQKYNL